MPGPGRAPPYLAGREPHQGIGLDCLESIRAGRNPGRDLILCGPRGNGKTAMLLWIEAEASSRGIQAISLASAHIRTEQELIASVAEPRNWIRRLGKVSWKGLQWQPHVPAPEALYQILARRLRKAPVALLIDEAQTLDIAVGQSILSVAQRFGGEGAPFVLVLAGTPSLSSHLSAMHVSFWERNEVLPFDRLRAHEAADAVRVPFEAGGRATGADALAEMVAESQGYPFFAQVWGQALWNSTEASATAVSADCVSRARAQFESRRNRLYGLRFDELERMGLVAAAAAVAEAFGSAEELGGHQMDNAVEATLRREGGPCDAKSVLAVRNDLHSLGYIWNPGSGQGGQGGRYVPGIPSLMDFVLNSVRCN